MQARSWPGGSWGPDPPEVRRATPVNHANPKRKFCPTPSPPPTTHPRIKQDRDLPKIFSVSEWREEGGWSYFRILSYPITGYSNLVPGTAAIRRRRQSMKLQVEVKSMNHRPAADCAPCRLLVDLMHFIQLRQRIFCSATPSVIGCIHRVK